jgi:hypothetical protein
MLDANLNKQSNSLAYEHPTLTTFVLDGHGTAYAVLLGNMTWDSGYSKENIRSRNDILYSLPLLWFRRLLLGGLLAHLL